MAVNDSIHLEVMINLHWYVVPFVETELNDVKNSKELWKGESRHSFIWSCGNFIVSRTKVFHTVVEVSETCYLAINHYTSKI